MQKKNFDVTGMSCSACSARVEKAVSSIPGVDNVNVNLLKNSMTVEFDDAKTNVGEIVKAVTDAGYGASERSEDKGGSVQTADPALEAKKASEEMKFRLWVSLIFAGILMILAMGPMLGMPLPEILSGTKNAPINALTQFLLTLPVIFVNFKYFRNGFKSLWHRAPNMDSLVAIGSAASVLFGLFALYMMLWALAQGNEKQLAHYAHNLYFDSAAMILALITLGKYFESRAKHKTTDAISKLMALVPENALVERDGKQEVVPLEQIAVGDLVLLKTGSRVPVDGVVEDGSGTVDESSLTGESVPVEKTVGSQMSASTLLTSGYIKMKATRVGGDTALAQIIKLVDEATSTKPPVARLADKISGIFVPTVISIAIAASLVWLMLGYSWEFALMIGVSVLVISCPCALGLATPTAIMVGSGRGAQNGILFRSAEAIETTEKVNVIVLDKTGTVTSGKPALTDVVSFSLPPKELLSLVASVENKSEHPLAAAVVDGAKSLEVPLREASNFTQNLGNVSAQVIGKNVKIGNKSVVVGELPEQVRELADQLADQGKTPLYVLLDGKLSGLIAAADPVRADSKDAVQAMLKQDKEVWMLTGDNIKTAQAVAAQVGIKNIRAEVKPAEKEALVRELQEAGKKVMMVGDGINDAPSLARADVGAAIGAGTDVAIEAADIVIMKSRLSDVVNAGALSHSCMNNIRENLFWAFIYNIIGIPVAAGVFYTVFGWALNPMIAAAAMSMSSVSVVSNALRLRRWRPVLSGAMDNENQRMEPKLMNLAIEKTAAETPKYEYKIYISGMMCQHCVKAVTGMITGLPGVIDCKVDLEKGTADVQSSAPIDEAKLKSLIEEDGYKLESIECISTPGQTKGFNYLLGIEGMMCCHCVKSVTKKLSGLDGVVHCEVSLESKSAQVESSKPITESEFQQAIEEEGYELTEAREA